MMKNFQLDGYAAIGDSGAIVLDHAQNAQKNQSRSRL
jgi:hypothetical protein